METRDNNKLDQEIATRKVEFQTDESSDVESDIFNNAVYKEDALEQYLRIGHYSDDFLREITLESLLYYKERNDQEIQKTINVYSNTSYFNSAKKKDNSYVGTVFTQEDMKRMVQLHKKRRITFKRRVLQLMHRINPAIRNYYIEAANIHEKD